jgi:phage terminase large subunit-like protein
MSTDLSLAVSAAISAAVRDVIERCIADGALRHTGTSILRWNVGNAVVERRGNALAISKATSVGAGKIDGLAAVLTAAAAALSRADIDALSVYETRELIST